MFGNSNISRLPNGDTDFPPSADQNFLCSAVLVELRPTCPITTGPSFSAMSCAQTSPASRRAAAHDPANTAARMMRLPFRPATFLLEGDLDRWLHEASRENEPRPQPVRPVGVVL